MSRLYSGLTICYLKTFCGFTRTSRLDRVLSFEISKVCLLVGTLKVYRVLLSGFFNI